MLPETLIKQSIAWCFTVFTHLSSLPGSFPSERHHRIRWNSNITICREKAKLKAPANEDTLLRTHCCRQKCLPVCPRAQHLWWTQILCPGHKKCFWFCSETFCVRSKCFPVCAAQETSWATMYPSFLPGPLVCRCISKFIYRCLRGVLVYFLFFLICVFHFIG